MSSFQQQQKGKQQQQYCNRCKAPITFRKTDEKKPDGSPKWELLNMDGSLHWHEPAAKGQQQQQFSNTKPNPYTPPGNPENKKIVDVFESQSFVETKQRLEEGYVLYAALPCTSGYSAPPNDYSAIVPTYILVKYE